MREIVLVEPNERRIERYRRLDDGDWLLADVTEGTVDLDSVQVVMLLDAIYAKVDGLPFDEDSGR